MCELLGFSAKSREDIRTQLDEFFSHSSHNPHGWGMMYSGGIVRGCEKASDSASLGRMVKEMPPQDTVLAHIRYATVGSITPQNCHPFTDKDITGRQWTLIHNGTIYSGRALIPYLRHQTGDTDSERLFLYLLDRMNELQKELPLTAEERCKAVEQLVVDIAPRNKLNLMIYDGELLYIHKNMKDTMVYRKLGDGMVFATAAVDDEEWSDVPVAQFLAYRQGELFYKGRKHEGIFVPTLQYIKAMDAMNI